MALGEVFSRQQIETAANQLLSDFSSETGVEISFPIPAEQIAEDFFDLRLLWEPIQEPPDTRIYAKLTPSQQLVTFNESRYDEFEETCFLYHTVLGHEIGHWELHIERGDSAPKKSADDSALWKSNYHHSSFYWDEKNATRFMAALLMPKDLIIDEFKQEPITSFPQLYDLRDKCEVTVTSLKIRLEKLDLLHIDSEGNFNILYK